MRTEEQLKADLAAMGAVLDRRARRFRLLDRYYTGGAPLPDAIQRAKITRLYRLMMPVAEAPWASLVADSVLDRLEIAGLRDQNQDAADAVWNAWQAEQMDTESKLAHNACAVGGRAYALVWPEDGQRVWLDNPESMVVRYREGSRRTRQAALRRWMDDGGTPHAILYYADALYKFRGPKNTSGGGGTQWEMEQPAGEDWPLANPYQEVPVVEVAINRRLRPGAFPAARGTFEHCIGLLDRINLLTFLGLVVAFWMGFPIRGVVGEQILRDDDGNPIPPFEARPDSVVQFENPNARTFTYEAADRKNLSIFAELGQLAMITKTPRHYFPQETGLSNVSADTIRADEGALSAQVSGYQSTLGDGWEDVARLLGQTLEQKAELSPNASIQWKDHESRSLAERADAATKLKDLLPWQAVAERALNATQDDIARWEAMRSSEGLGAIIPALRVTETTPAAPATAGLAGGQ